MEARAHSAETQSTGSRLIQDVNLRVIFSLTAASPPKGKEKATLAGGSFQSLTADCLIIVYPILRFRSRGMRPPTGVPEILYHIGQVHRGQARAVAALSQPVDLLEVGGYTTHTDTVRPANPIHLRVGGCVQKYTICLAVVSHLSSLLIVASFPLINDWVRPVFSFWCGIVSAPNFPNGPQSSPYLVFILRGNHYIMYLQQIVNTIRLF